MRTQSRLSKAGAIGAVVIAALFCLVVVPVAACASPVSQAAERSTTTTFSFTNMPVRSALQLLAEEGHFNLVVSDAVQGTVSLHLVNVTWEQALDVVLQLKGLRQRVDGNTRSVSVSTEAEAP
jgi:type IV pilus assembly protein PilQ